MLRLLYSAILFFVLCGAGRVWGDEKGLRALAEQIQVAGESSEKRALQVKWATEALELLEAGEGSATKRKQWAAQIRSFCAELQLGALDLSFGEAIVLWARLELFEGDWSRARSTLLNQAAVLQAIEDALRKAGHPFSALSPMAGGRYWLGCTYAAERDALEDPALQQKVAGEALRHFLNVNVRYGDSPWGFLAGERAAEQRAFLESAGRRVRVRYRHPQRAMAQKFRFGERLMAQARYAEAEVLLLEALHHFPEEGKSSVDALVRLGRCWVELGKLDHLLVVPDYLLERFREEAQTPVGLLELGRLCMEHDLPAEGTAIFRSYLEAFPADEHVAEIEQFLGWQAWHEDAFLEAARWFGAASADAVLPAEQIELQQLKAECEVKAEQWEAAADSYAVLEALFSTEGATNSGLEQAVFQQGICLAHGTNVVAAIAALDRFLERYPASEQWCVRAQNEKVLAFLRSAQLAQAGAMVEKLLEVADQLPEETLELLAQALLEEGAFDLADRVFATLECAAWGRARCAFGLEAYARCLEWIAAMEKPTFEGLALKAKALEALGEADAVRAVYGEMVLRAATELQRYEAMFELAKRTPEPEAQLAAFQRIVLLANPDVVALQPLIEEALWESVPCCMAQQRFELAVQCCDQLKRLCPEHPRLAELSRWRKEARDAMR